jgi:hypothetical protein
VKREDEYDTRRRQRSRDRSRERSNDKEDGNDKGKKCVTKLFGP